MSLCVFTLHSFIIIMYSCTYLSMYMYVCMYVYIIYASMYHVHMNICKCTCMYI